MPLMAKTTRVNFRTSGKDWVRFNEVWERVLERTYDEAKMTNFIKELIGIRPPKMVKPEERAYLSGRVASLPERKQRPASVVEPNVQVRNK